MGIFDGDITRSSSLVEVGTVCLLCGANVFFKTLGSSEGRVEFCQREEVPVPLT